MERKLKKENTKKIILTLFFIILLLPIVVYVYEFGFVVSSDHQRWAEFGSAISGIYSPAIAFLALLILVGQFKAQAAMNKHQYDQAFIQDSRKDLDYYLEKIEEALNEKHVHGQSVRNFLLATYTNVNDEHLKSLATIEAARVFNVSHPKIQNMWLAIYPLLIGLESQKEFPYVHNFSGSKLRVSSVLEYGTCVAIDNFIYCITNDLYKGNYFYRGKDEI